jgi:hypothetical protein
MKKLATFVFALLLAVSLSFAQTGGDKTKGKSDNPQESSKTDTKGGKKGHHKGGKKSKKNSGSTTTPPPK